MLPATVWAQTVVTGTVRDAETGSPLPFANVWLDSVYDGSTTNETGYFQFSTTAEGEALLRISSVGYADFEQLLRLNGDTLQLQAHLVPNQQELAPITISAGAFGAADRDQSVLLRPLDIVKTPGAQGDIFGALQRLPGVQPMPNETGIFVRGGEAYETRAFIDGTLVDKPFFSEVPNIPGRGRFDPFLFQGTLFSTGGYSAEFGQALSSVLTLNTQDFPEQSQTGIGINGANLNLSHTEIQGNTALLLSAGYANLNPLYSLSQTFTEFEKAPEGGGISLGFRQKTAKNGLWKGMFRYDHTQLGIRYPDFSESGSQALQLNNHNFYNNISYRGGLGNGWQLQLGLSYSRDRSDLQIGTDGIPSDEQLAQAKATFGKDLRSNLYFKTGTEWHWRKGDFGFNEFRQSFQELYNGSFAEAEWQPYSKLAIRAGLRSDVSAYLQQMALMPRLSLAYSTGENSQVSMAYGHFYQTPPNEFLRQSSGFGFEKATHYLLNFQHTSERYTFRAELYHKMYDQLLRQTSASDTYPATFENSGFGHASGLDIFWRDQKALGGLLDYWLTYSFLDTERLYRDFPEALPPRFAATHTAQAVAMLSLPGSRWQLGSSFSFSSGRPFYFGDDFPGLRQERTPELFQLGLNASYLTSLFKQFTVVYFSLDNPFGWKNITGYRIHPKTAERLPLHQPVGRTFFMGLFVSI